MNLSDIRGRGIPLARFFHATGGNGHILGRGQVAHAWMVERGTPPHLTPETPEWLIRHIPGQRTWWNPYNMAPHENFRTPLCQNLRTNARFGRLTPTWANHGTRCQECIDIVTQLGQPEFNEAIKEDPWLAIPTADRQTALDPVSGL